MPDTEELYRKAIDSIDFAVHVADTELNIKIFNTAFHRWCDELGLDIGTPVGRTVADVFPFISDKSLREYEQVIQTGRTIVSEDTTAVSGRGIITETRKSPIYTGNKITHVLTVIKDITDQVRAREALRENEENYRLLMESVPASIAVNDYDGRFLFINQLGAQQMGKTVDEIIDATHWDIFPPEVADRQVADIRRVIDEGVPFNAEKQTFTNNEWRWYHIVLQPFGNAQGDRNNALIIATDITQRKQDELALRESKEKYQLLIESVPLGITVIDRDGQFLFVNPLSAQKLGKAAEDIVGSTHWDYFPKDVADRQMRNIKQVIDDRIEFREETRTFVNNEWRWYRVIIRPYDYSPGEDTAALVMATDITPRKNNEIALQESEERYRLQYMSIPVPTYTWKKVDDDFVFIEFNKAAEIITHGHIAEYLGQRASEMYTNQAETFEDMNRCLSSNGTIRREMPYHFKSTGEDKFLIVHYVYVPPDLVIVHTEDITDRKRAEEELQNSYDQLETRVKERTRELAEANEALRVEREALEQKTIALKEILNQVEEGKKQMASQIQSNIDRIVFPVMEAICRKLGPDDQQHVSLLRSSLADIVSPFVSRLETRYAQLAQRELEICHMIKNGLSSKEIADTLNTSVQTVLKQRATIRKKLGIAHTKTNLSSHLKSIA